MVVSFIKELWENIFTPGSSPALVKATHASFAGLLLTICIMLYVTGSFHFVALMFLSLGLWVAVTWFITEYNKFLAQQDKENSSTDNSSTENPSIDSSRTGKSSTESPSIEQKPAKQPKATNVKKRRV